MIGYTIFVFVYTHYLKNRRPRATIFPGATLIIDNELRTCEKFLYLVRMFILSFAAPGADKQAKKTIKFFFIVNLVDLLHKDPVVVSLFG